MTLAIPAKIKRLWRYAGLGIRLLIQGRARARYVRAVRASGLFDRGWYLACNPRLPLLCRLLPERHYVLVGEDVGLCPGPGFSPRAYSHLNPDQAASGLAPLAHYLAQGGRARAVLDHPAGVLAPAFPAIAAPDPSAPFAIVLHLYYRSMWPEIAAHLRNTGFAFDLFVTLTDDPTEADGEVRATILAAFPRAQIWTLPNHGRDLLPFLHLAQSGVLSPYAALCKLHTKTSPHRADGDHWRHALISGVLGHGAQTATRLATFCADPAAGLWVADEQRLSGPQWWGQNRARAAQLLARAGLDPDPEGLCFAAGSIWWISPSLLGRLAALPLGPADFELEMGQVDGTTAHALERAFGFVAADAGLRIVQSGELDAPRFPPQKALTRLKSPAKGGALWHG